MTCTPVDEACKKYQVGSFNVPTAGGVVPVTTGIIVGDTGQNAKISLGVVKDGARSNASVSFVNGETLDLFPVNASDQMDAEIYLDSNSNQWLIFIEDENTATYYANEFSYTTIITYAGWLASVNDSPLPAMNPILFTNARWFSNWADWQPIPSSAAAYYIQWTLDKSPGLIQTTILIGSPPGTSFYLATCATCS
ncbi:MAG TPA: hypothetical protein VFB12_08375 [Ktedonobacteraceae bacterium]|nr:hypothetical protein [Ktedonobacteraceae bacterium]